MTATANRAGGREPLEERLKERAPLISECLTLVFSSDASLAEHLDSIDLVFREIGDPLKKVWIEDEAGRTKSVAADQAIAWLRQHPGFRTYAAMPESERGNDRATWLSSAMAFNLQPYRKTLFLGIPWPQTGSGAYAMHLRLLRYILERQKTEPAYGFGFRRPYGLGPGSYSMGVNLLSGGMYPTPDDMQRVIAWSTELTGNPEKFPKRHRHTKGMILDVFPLNILSDVHLSQQVNGVELRQWILQSTGTDSLVELSRCCFVWLVDEVDVSRLSGALAGAGLILAKDPAR